MKGAATFWRLAFSFFAFGLVKEDRKEAPYLIASIRVARQRRRVLRERLS
jgi:hypothetical protein